MELSLGDLGKIIMLDSQPQDGEAVSHLPELTPEDEAVLERAWRVLAAEQQKPAVCLTMSDEDTRQFFALNN